MDLCDVTLHGRYFVSKVELIKAGESNGKCKAFFFCSCTFCHSFKAAKVVAVDCISCLAALL